MFQWDSVTIRAFPLIKLAAFQNACHDTPEHASCGAPGPERQSRTPAHAAMSHQLSDPRLPCRRDLCRKWSYNFMMTESPAWPCGTLAMLLLGEPRLLVVRGPLRPGFLGSSASEVLGCRQQVFRLWGLTATTISRRVRPPQHERRQSTQSKTWGGGDFFQNFFGTL